MTKKSNLRKNFIWNIIGTTFSSFNSLFFMIIVTRINGVHQAGIFTFAFATACLFYVVGTYFGRTYQVTDLDNKINDSDYFYSKIFTCIFMILLVTAFCFIRNYDGFKTQIVILLTIYKMIEAFSEGVYAIIQKKDDLYKVGQSLFFKAILSLLSFFILDYFTKNLILSSSLIIVSNLCILLLFDFPILKKYKFNFNKFSLNKIIYILKKGFCTFGFSFLTIYLTNAPKYAIDSIMINKYQTIFGIIIMPATVLILFSQYIIQPFLIRMKEDLYCSSRKFLFTIFKMSTFILITGILCLIIAYFIGIPVLELLYSISLSKYLGALLIIICGAIFYGISVVLSTALTTMRFSFCQLIIFLIASMIALIISNILVRNYGVYGASYAYMITMLILVIMYFIVFIYKLKKRKRKNG